LRNCKDWKFNYLT